jgi:hypothetical protein
MYMKNENHVNERNRARLTTVPAMAPLRFLSSRRKRPTTLGGSMLCGEPKNVREFSGFLRGKLCDGLFGFFRLFGPTTRTDLWPLGLVNPTVRTVWTDSANPWPSPLIGLLFEPRPSNDIHHDLQFLWQTNS